MSHARLIIGNNGWIVPPGNSERLAEAIHSAFIYSLEPSSGLSVL